MSHRHQASFVSRIRNLHVGRIGVASALAGSLLLGCSNQQVKVEMVAGEAGPERIFETNRTNRDEIGRLSEAYETAPMERAGGRDGVRFEGVFAERDLPSEIGNRNGWSTLPGSFGTAYYYIEQFGAARDDWTAFRDRMNAGELWIRFAISFFESRIDGVATPMVSYRVFVNSDDFRLDGLAADEALTADPNPVIESFRGGGLRTHHLVGARRHDGDGIVVCRADLSTPFLERPVDLDHVVDTDGIARPRIDPIWVADGYQHQQSAGIGWPSLRSDDVLAH